MGAEWWRCSCGGTLGETWRCRFGEAGGHPCGSWVVGWGGRHPEKNGARFGWSLGFAWKTEPETLEEELAKAALWLPLARAVSLSCAHGGLSRHGKC